MTDPRDFNRQVVETFRANQGVMGGPWEGKRVILLHHVGLKSGREYVVPLVAANDGEAYLVVGSMGGAPTDPRWVRNIEAGPGHATIEVGDDTLQAKTAVVRPDSPEWEQLYGIWSAYWPDSKSYEANTSRKFPVIRLEPVDGRTVG